MTTKGEPWTKGEAGFASFELKVTIDAPREKVWRTFTQGIDAWWLPSFHMVGEGSALSFDARAGGHLVERREGGGSLLWGTVQMVDPGSSIYLSGVSAAEWGGPLLSILRFSFADTADGGTVVTMGDSIVGRVDDANLTSTRDGWTELLEKGLKATVETGSPAV